MPRPKIEADTGAVDLRHDVGDAFDDVLDEMHSTQGSALCLTQEEIDAAMRAEQEFMLALKVHCNAALRDDGMRVLRTRVSVDGEGYDVFATDREGREYVATYKIQDGLEASSVVREGHLGRHIFEKVTRSIRDARRRYFARMQ